MTTATTSKPDQQERTEHDVITRSAPLAGFNEETRSIGCTLTTDQPVMMFDYRSGEFFDEVLLADGGRMPDKLVLLDSHMRYSSHDVYGSVRDLKQEKNGWSGRIYFAEGIERVEDIYKLVKQGHLDNVSIGYKYSMADAIEIPKGQSANINGREFKAKDRRLRVATKWQGRELSVCPIGADDQAKMRCVVDSKFRQANVAVDDSNSIDASQTDANHSTTQERTMSATAATAQPIEQTAAPQTASENRSEIISPKQAASTVDAEAIRKEAAEAERTRQAYIGGFVGKVDQKLIDEARSSNWSESEINSRFLTAITSGRTTPTAPAIHVANNQLGRADLQAILLKRAGVDVENSNVFKSSQGEATFRRGDEHEMNMRWAVDASRTLGRNGKLSDEADRALNLSHKFRSISLIGICELALESKGIRYERFDYDDIATRASSTADVAALFSNTLAAMILEAFTTAQDTTDWVAEEDLPNFQPAEIVKMGMASKLRKRKREQVPEHAAFEATKELIQLSTFSEQFFLDRQDLIDDRFGELGRTPSALGDAAAELRPDLVYSTLLSNPNMADGQPIFSTAHANNTINTAFSIGALQTLDTRMSTQVNNGRLITASAGYLIVPKSRQWDAEVIMNSVERRDNTANAVYGTVNPAVGRYKVRGEARLDTGVINPDTGVNAVAQTGAYYLADARKRWGLVVAYLRSAGRGPIIKRWEPGDGRIGIGTTVEMDIGIKAAAWEGLQRGTSAGA